MLDQLPKLVQLAETNLLLCDGAAKKAFVLSSISTIVGPDFEKHEKLISCAIDMLVSCANDPQLLNFARRGCCLGKK